MIKLKSLLLSEEKNGMINEGINIPPPTHYKSNTNITQPNINNNISRDFIKYMEFVENSIYKGYDKNKNLYYPYESVEGGSPTIAFGHKIKNKQELENFKKGISQGEAEKLLMDDIQHAENIVDNYINKRYKVKIHLTEKQKEMLTDFAFNLGTLNTFPKFVDGVLRNDMNVMRKEYKRYSGGKELTGRNKAFFERYLK